MPIAPLQRGNPHPNEATCWPWVVTRNAWGWDPGGWAVCDPATEKATWLATLHFGPYKARRAVAEARSDQSAGHVSSLLDLCKNPNEDDGCRANYAVEGILALSVPGQVVILGTKTQGQNKIVKHQHEYTEHVALILWGEWVFP